MIGTGGYCLGCVEGRIGLERGDYAVSDDLPGTDVTLHRPIVECGLQSL